MLSFLIFLAILVVREKNMKRILPSAICLAFLCCLAPAFANNISVTNVRLGTVYQTPAFAMIEFDLAWENSWRDTLNHDAAWVFVKYRPVGNTGPWSHATLNYVNGLGDGHMPAPGAAIDATSDGKGAFLYRSAPGAGNVSFAGNRLRWNYGADNVPHGTAVDIQVLAIEMVHVPAGAFWLGDGETDPAQVYGHFEAGTSGAPFAVSSEAAVTLGGGAPGSLGNNNRRGTFVQGGCLGCVDCSPDGCLAGSGDDFDDVTTQQLPAAYPKGVNAFYCMKYELTQQEIVDMVNMCSPTQAAFIMDQAHFYLGNGNPATNRWGFVNNSGTWSTTQPYTPVIYCDWMRAAAYADWSGLRPMTEFEFEKACRGPVSPVLRGYAWGNDAVDLSANLTTTNAGLPDEQVATGYNAGGALGNCWVRAGGHTMQTVGRVGIFAAHPGNTGRVTSGGSYYGIMELSGHAWERAVSVGHPEGRKFTGLHGDGNLDAAGYADVANWPGTFAGATVSSNVGVGYRGGALAYPGPDLERNARISSRRVGPSFWNAVIQDDGTRFVRTAP